MPEVEVGEVDGVREWRSRERAVLVKTVHDRLRSKNLRVGAFDNLFALAVDPVNQRLRMALGADLLHVDLRLQVVRAMRRDGIGEVPAESIRWIVRNLEAIDAAHVTSRTGWHKHVSRRQGTRIGIKVEQISLRSE